MGNIKHIAIDTGKRNTKVVFEMPQAGHSQEISFPTAIAEGIDETADSNSHIIEFNGESYLVGEQALTVSEIDSANSKNNEIHKICILTALGLAFKSGTTVEAVIGIPLDLYMNKEEKKNYRDNMLPVGEIEFKIDGEIRKIIVAKTIIRPEGYGAIYNRREDIADSIINVVDIGGLNMNACEYRMGKMQELSRKTMQMGGKYLYTQSLDAIRKAVTPDERKRMENLTAEDFEHYVVIAKDYATGRLIVGFDHLETKGLYATQVRVFGLNFIEPKPHNGEILLAKPRYRDPSQKITWAWLNETTAELTFSEPQRALATGQALAFYRNDCLIGGGIYAEIVG